MLGRLGVGFAVGRVGLAARSLAVVFVPLHLVVEVLVVVAFVMVLFLDLASSAISSLNIGPVEIPSSVQLRFPWLIRLSFLWFWVKVSASVTWCRVP